MSLHPKPTPIKSKAASIKIGICKITFYDFQSFFGSDTANKSFKNHFECLHKRKFYRTYFVKAEKNIEFCREELPDNIATTILQNNTFGLPREYASCSLPDKTSHRRTCGKLAGGNVSDR